MKTDSQVAGILSDLYDEEFAGKSGQRYVMAWSDLRSIYGFAKLFQSRFDSLATIAPDWVTCGIWEMARMAITLR